MRATRRPALLVLSLLLAVACPAAAQDAGYSQVDLRDGGSLFGRVIETGERVRIVVAAGDTLDLPRSQVERIREVRGEMVDGQFMRADPNETRLFFGPTARTLPAGDAYLGVFELFMPFLAIGVTDRITIAGGTPLIFGEGMPVAIYLAPKVQLLRSELVTGSIGTLSFFGDGGSAGVAYGVITADHRDGRSSLTVGAGWGYVEDEVSDELVVILGGDARVSRSLKLLSENYFFPGEGAVLTGGFRFLGERLSADVGLALPIIGSEGGFALPLVNFVYSF